MIIGRGNTEETRINPYFAHHESEMGTPPGDNPALRDDKPLPNHESYGTAL
jgi:hypothetical protein